VTSTGVSGRFACGFRTNLHSADAVGWEDAADYFGETDKKYDALQLMVAAIV
jgi:hypothetical protein